MEQIYYFGGKAKDLVEDVRQHLTYEEEEILCEDEQLKHREEPLEADPE